MQPVLTAIAFGLTFAAALPALADLEWETQRINHTASIADDKAEVAFKFTNTGDKPVTIESVRTSCGCTTAELDKKTYAPGGSGKVTTTFAFGDRTGTQHKRITIRTSTPAPGIAPGIAPGSSTLASNNVTDREDKGKIKGHSTFTDKNHYRSTTSPVLLSAFAIR